MARPVSATVRMSRTEQSAKVAATEDSGSAPADDTSAFARPTVTRTTQASATVLISALIASHMPWRPKIFFSPVSGLSFLKSGLIDLPEIETPPWAAVAATPVAIRPSAVGSTAVRKPVSASPMSAEIAEVSGCWATAPTCTNSCCAVVNDLATSIGNSTLAAATPTHVPSSGVRAICPSLRAFFRRWGVGFSVFSPPGPSLAISGSAHHGPRGSPALERDDGTGGVLDEGVQCGRQQREGQAEQAQGDHDLHREAELEDVERGCRPRQQRESDVGQQEDGDQRPGDLQRGEEHHAQRRHQHVPQRSGGHGAADGQPLVR